MVSHDTRAIRLLVENYVPICFEISEPEEKNQLGTTAAGCIFSTPDLRTKQPVILDILAFPRFSPIAAGIGFTGRPWL